ncbi:MAG TPA: hemolysin family protein, partial [Fimbriimonas sp.]|nr:hemolysin family protein [Fimbriimonas sp.]
MSGDTPVPGIGPNIAVGIVLLVFSAFFVGGEYAVVSMRRSRLEGMAKRGNNSAKALLKISENLSNFIAGTQVGITMVGVAMGSITEPFVTHQLMRVLPGIDQGVGQLLSFILVLFFLVVLGELVPKYIALKHPERFMMYTYRPLGWFVWLFRVVIWLAQVLSQIILKPLKIDIKEAGKETVAKEELIMMIQATSSEGILEKAHADLVSRALQLDALVARDIMVHRLDIKWLDVDCTPQEVLARIGNMRYSRVPVCRGDIDDIVGIAYMVDLLKAINSSDFDLEKLARPFVAIPENLPMERIVQTMREQKSQVVIVLDEYGGTSGLISLEDVVEEVFGELEDGPESERPPIDIDANGRISARAETRFDELVARLGLDVDTSDRKESLANIIVDTLGRIPRPGDSVDT